MCSLCRERAAERAAEVEAAETSADVVALIVARRERYRTAARSARKRATDTTSVLDLIAALDCETHWLAKTDALTALLRDMGVTE